jgi:hypothetical protein
MPELHAPYSRAQRTQIVRVTASRWRAAFSFVQHIDGNNFLLRVKPVAEMCVGFVVCSVAISVETRNSLITENKTQHTTFKQMMNAEQTPLRFLFNIRTRMPLNGESKTAPRFLPSSNELLIPAGGSFCN